MKHIIFVRHSKVARDPSIASHQWPLSANGRLLSQQLAAKLATYNPTRVLTSHESKAQETGQIIANHYDINCHAVDGLQEHDRQGVPYLPSQQDFFAAVENFFNHPTELVFGNETAVQARTRFTTAINQQIAKYPQDTLLIAAHGTVLTLFITQHNPQIETLQFWQNLPLPCALICTLPDFKFTKQIT